MNRRERHLVVGVGTRRGVSVSGLRSALASCLDAGEADTGDVIAIVTAEGKQKEPAVLQLCDELSVPLTVFSAETLAQQRVPNPSVTVQRTAGTPSVAEAAVLASGAQLLLPKQVATDVTMALGVLPGCLRTCYEMESR